MKLELGCGKAKRERFVSVDISADCDADIVHDLEDEFAHHAQKEQRFTMHHYVNAVHELTALLRLH